MFVYIVIKGVSSSVYNILEQGNMLTRS